ncbi:MAG: carboxypeptidase-like regulatory domain-containing protein [Saprospiraceae bacterium]
MKWLTFALITLLFGGFSPLVVPEKAAEAPYTLEGYVLDGEEPLVGASILIKGTAIGTVTDAKGYFALKTDSLCTTVEVTYTGYDPLVVEGACANTVHRFQLEAGIALDEVVVVAYKAPMVEMDMVTSGATISESRIKSLPTRSVSALKGTTAGMSAAASEKSDVSRAIAMTQELPNAGQLTAGEINDFGKWELWEDIAKEDLQAHRSTWHQYADHRYSLQLTNREGIPLVNATVELMDNQGNVLWKARTDVAGRAELWAHYFAETEKVEKSLTISGAYKGQTFKVPQVKPFQQGINFHVLDASCEQRQLVDVAFVVDATGSMGDEIQYLQSEMMDVIERVQDSLFEADLQWGAFFIRMKEIHI